jgi:hypothetical protein
MPFPRSRIDVRLVCALVLLLAAGASAQVEGPYPQGQSDTPLVAKSYLITSGLGPFFQRPPDVNATLTENGPKSMYLPTGTPVALVIEGAPGANWEMFLSTSISVNAATTAFGQVDVDIPTAVPFLGSLVSGNAPPLDASGVFSTPPIAWPAGLNVIFQVVLLDGAGYHLSAAVNARDMGAATTLAPVIEGRYFGAVGAACPAGVRDFGGRNWGPPGTDFSMGGLNFEAENGPNNSLHLNDGTVPGVPQLVRFVRPNRIYGTYTGSTFSGNINVTNQFGTYADAADVGQSWWFKTTDQSQWVLEGADLPATFPSPTILSLTGGMVTFQGRYDAAGDLDAIELSVASYFPGQSLHVELASFDDDGSTNLNVTDPMLTMNGSAYGTSQLNCLPYLAGCPQPPYGGIATGLYVGYNAEDTFLHLRDLNASTLDILAQDDGGPGTASRLGGVGNGVAGVYGEATCPSVDPCAAYVFSGVESSGMGFLIDSFPNPPPSATTYPCKYVMTVMVQ